MKQSIDERMRAFDERIAMREEELERSNRKTATIFWSCVVVMFLLLFSYAT